MEVFCNLYSGLNPSYGDDGCPLFDFSWLIFLKQRWEKKKRESELTHWPRRHAETISGTGYVFIVVLQ